MLRKIAGFCVAVPKVRIHFPPAKSRANFQFLSGGVPSEKGATNRLTAPAYWKFESISLQQRVCKLSVPREHQPPESYGVRRIRILAILAVCKNWIPAGARTGHAGTAITAPQSGQGFPRRCRVVDRKSGTHTRQLTLLPHRRQCGTGISPDRDITAPLRDVAGPCESLSTAPLAPARTPAGNRGFSTYGDEFSRETGSHLNALS